MNQCEQDKRKTNSKHIGNERLPRWPLHTHRASHSPTGMIMYYKSFPIKLGFWKLTFYPSLF